jgi:hypothetical protein
VKAAEACLASGERGALEALLRKEGIYSSLLSDFIVLFFWLTGLRIRGERFFAALLSAGVASYYLAFTLARWLPFHALLYPVCAACAVLSGLLPGYFFRLMGRRYAPVRSPLFHENNGFLVGLVIALKAAVHFGSFMLAGGPLAGAALVAVALAAGGRDPER